MSKAVTVTVKDQFDALIALIARVAVFQGGALVTFQDTDALGVADFLLEEGDYVVRILLTTGAYEASTPYAMTVGADVNDFEITVTKVVFPAVSNPHLCLCGGYVTYQSSDQMVFELQQGDEFGFRESSLTDIHFPVSTVLRCESSVPTIAELPRGVRYRVVVHRLPSWEIIVPDAASAALQDVLFPLLDTLLMASSTLSLEVGDEEEVAYTERYLSGLVLDPAEDSSLIDQVLSEAAETIGVEFVSSDDSVATVTKGAGIITIKGVGAGTAVISANIAQLFGVEGAIDEVASLVTVEVT